VEPTDEHPVLGRTVWAARKVIGQAIGILMERYEMNEDRAFAFLVRASSHGNVKLRSVAQELVDQRNRGEGSSTGS